MSAMDMDTEALDRLLEIQLKLVDAKLQEAKATNGDRSTFAPHQVPTSHHTRVVKHPAHAQSAKPSQQRGVGAASMEAQVARLAALDQQQAALAAQCTQFAASKASRAQMRAPRRVQQQAPLRLNEQMANRRHFSKEMEPMRAELDGLRCLIEESAGVQSEILKHMRHGEHSQSSPAAVQGASSLWQDHSAAALPGALPAVFGGTAGYVGFAADPDAAFGGTSQLQDPASVEAAQPRAVEATSASKAEEALLEQLHDVLQDVSDEEDERAPRGRHGSLTSEGGASERPLERGTTRGGRRGSQERRRGSVETRAFSSKLGLLAWSLWFVHQLKSKHRPLPASAEEVAAMLEDVHEAAVRWLSRGALRQVLVHGAIKDVDLHLDLSARIVKSEQRAHGAQGKRLLRLKVRAKAMLDAAREAMLDVPPGLLEKLHFLCSRRLFWPEADMAPVLPSCVQASLRPQPDGSFAPGPKSAIVLAAHLLVTRVLVHELCLRPNSNNVYAGKLGARQNSNLKMLASVLHSLTKLVCGADFEAVSGLNAAQLQSALSSSHPLEAELLPEFDHLREHGVRALAEWLQEGALALADWLQHVLASAEARSRGVEASAGCPAWQWASAPGSPPRSPSRASRNSAAKSQRKSAHEGGLIGRLSRGLFRAS